MKYISILIILLLTSCSEPSDIFYYQNMRMNLSKESFKIIMKYEYDRGIGKPNTSIAKLEESLSIEGG